MRTWFEPEHAKTLTPTSMSTEAATTEMLDAEAFA
jgi:hypothetical protein